MVLLGDWSNIFFVCHRGLKLGEEGGSVGDKRILMTRTLLKLPPSAVCN